MKKIFTLHDVDSVLEYLHQHHPGKPITKELMITALVGTGWTLRCSPSVKQFLSLSPACPSHPSTPSPCTGGVASKISLNQKKGGPDEMHPR